MWPNPEFPLDLVTFTKEILDGNVHFLYRVNDFENLKNTHVAEASAECVSGVWLWKCFSQSIKVPAEAALQRCS